MLSAGRRLLLLIADVTDITMAERKICVLDIVVCSANMHFLKTKRIVRNETKRTTQA